MIYGDKNIKPFKTVLVQTDINYSTVILPLIFRYTVLWGIITTLLSIYAETMDVQTGSKLYHDISKTFVIMIFMNAERKHTQHFIGDCSLQANILTRFEAGSGSGWAIAQACKVKLKLAVNFQFTHSIAVTWERTMSETK